ncbi:MAG: hypothetical protein E7599_06080 [Ruminococcaceae bacterium]|nr:hypothetical protein [Oscillospiraceae bacterium]
MKKNVDAALRRKEKWERKQKKQTKVLTVLGIAALVLVAVTAIAWALYSAYLWKTADISLAEQKALFESTEAIPKKGDPLLGTWFYFTPDGEKIDSKYIFDESGKLEVLKLDDSIPEFEDYMRISIADYRVRKSAGKIYVWAKNDENAKDKDRVVTYGYKVEKKGDAYVLTWEYENGTVWKMIRAE